MRTRQDSNSSTVPKLGIGRGVSLPRRHNRLIENARLRTELRSKHSSQLRISNRERMAISRPRSSLFSGLEPLAPNLQILIANADASSIGILSDQRESKGLPYRSLLRHQTFSTSNRKCRCVQHRHPERPTGVEGSLLSLSPAPPTFSTSNRKSGIKTPPNHPQNQSHAIL